MDSFDTKAQKNTDGSVDVYFGPKPPAGKESNWLYTAPGQPWFTYFRFYVPEKAVFDTNRRNFRQAHFLDLIGSDQALIS